MRTAWTCASSGRYPEPDSSPDRPSTRRRSRCTSSVSEVLSLNSRTSSLSTWPQNARTCSSSSPRRPRRADGKVTAWTVSGVSLRSVPVIKARSNGQPSPMQQGKADSKLHPSACRLCQSSERRLVVVTMRAPEVDLPDQLSGPPPLAPDRARAPQAPLIPAASLALGSRDLAAHESTYGLAIRAVRESQPSASRPQDAGLKIGGDPTCGGPVDLRANCRTARIACSTVL